MTRSNSHAEATRTLRVQFVDGSPQGMRHIDSPASIVRLTAGALPALNKFTKAADNGVGFIV